MRDQVSPAGIREAKIAIVSDFPEDEEVSRGSVFSPLSFHGRHLRTLLKRVAINSSELYYTSLFKFQPLHNKIQPYIRNSKKEGVITSQQYEMSVAALHTELQSVSANVFVPMGDASLYALAGQWGAYRRRGSIYKGTGVIQHRKVIGTIHPKLGLKMFELNYSILADLQRIKGESEFAEVILPDLKMIKKPTMQQSVEYLNKCMVAPQVSFDIEVANGEVSCISFSIDENEGISIPFVWGGFNHHTVEEETELWYRIGLVLENPSVTLLTQNGTFDTTYLFDKYGIRCNCVEDTMIQHAILYPELKKGLDFITSTQTKIQYYKDEGKFRKGEFRATDMDFAGYSIKDSIALTTAFPKLKKILINQGNQETYDYQRKLIPILSYMNTLGMKIDTVGIQAAKIDALHKRDDAKAKIVEMSEGIIDNPNSIPQLKKYFYGVLGIKPIRAKGSVTTDDAAMKKISLMGYEIADYIQTFRFNKTYSGQFYGVILGDDGRLRNSTNPVGTKNGRLSSSDNIDGEGTNVQNLPHLMKRYVLADEGYLMYDFDLGQAENRIVAYIAPEPAMIEAFETGIDVHKKTAGLVFNVPIEEVGDDDANPCTFGNGKHTQRFWGKQSNHSFNYDLGSTTYARKNGILVSDAKFLIDKYHESYPGIRRMHEWVRDELNRNKQTLVNSYGRYRKFIGRSGDSMHKQAYNFIPQSTVADKINREGLIYLYYNQDLFKHVQLLNQVHDSIVLQIPLSVPFEQHAEIIAHLRASLEKEIVWQGRRFVIPLDAKIGFNLSKFHKERNPKGMIDVDISNNINVSEITHNLKDSYARLINAS